MDKPFGYEPKIECSNHSKNTMPIWWNGRRSGFRTQLLQVRILLSVQLLYKFTANIYTLSNNSTTYKSVFKTFDKSFSLYSF